MLSLLGLAMWPPSPDGSSRRRVLGLPPDGVLLRRELDQQLVEGGPALRGYPSDKDQICPACRGGGAR